MTLQGPLTPLFKTGKRGQEQKKSVKVQCRDLVMGIPSGWKSNYSNTPTCHEPGHSAARPVCWLQIHRIPNLSEQNTLVLSTPVIKIISSNTSSSRTITGRAAHSPMPLLRCLVKGQQASWFFLERCTVAISCSLEVIFMSWRLKYRRDGERWRRPEHE